MTKKSLGVAVIGAGMVGRAHAAGYRTASQLYDLDLPEIRLVAIADAHEPFAVDGAKRFGYERAETSWQAIVDAPDIDVVSVAIANELHRPVVEALLAVGKHVLCEKPLAPSVEDAKAMVAAAEAAGSQSGVGFSFRRTPGINAIREQVQAGAIGDLRHFNGHYWCDYAQDPKNPISWRYKGAPGTGALADIGSHMIDLGEYLCGPIASVSGAVFQTFTRERPKPLGATVGHAGGAVSDQTEPVENEDIATFTATFAGGAVGTFSISRVAHGLPNGLGFEVFGGTGAAAFDLNRPGEFTFADQGAGSRTNGYRQVLIGPQHPGILKGIPMDFPSVGHGQNDLFAWQCRAFLDQVAGLGKLPPVPSLAEGLHNMEILAAVSESAAGGGKTVSLA
ncbi:Gfo/Idh/MocA family oxidoreductase [Antribacter sp. KLBMP9083]|uniref:Gfo/Idh/MocA family oxidoreductase n=1 Tax=Antribacter soli TaxID=2910976 RepID=A0AA41QI07_9MICO|nr:Gfo/Idh/MocA family oxidoreductase [Antribacter soli]MCF4123096.1 Gfo/Idh/MocA family oxidoreductase [Antribacter soli]